MEFGFQFLNACIYIMYLPNCCTGVHNRPSFEQLGGSLIWRTISLQLSCANTNSTTYFSRSVTICLCSNNQQHSLVKLPNFSTGKKKLTLCSLSSGLPHLQRQVLISGAKLQIQRRKFDWFPPLSVHNLSSIG